MVSIPLSVSLCSVTITTGKNPLSTMKNNITYTGLTLTETRQSTFTAKKSRVYLICINHNLSNMAKSHRKAPIVDLAKIVNEIVAEYGEEVERDVAKILPEVAENVVNELHTNPTPVETGEYRQGWTMSPETNALGRVTVTVYNKNKPQLTHLLEFGHALKRGGRTIGQVAPKKHIQKRSDYAEKLLMKKVEEQLQK